MLDICWFMFFSELVSTQLHPCHFAAIMFWRSITFPLMKWLSLLSKARRIVCKIWNLIGMNLLVLLWGWVGSSGLVQLYSFGDGSISNAVMIFLYVSMPHKDYAVQKTYVMESYLHLLFLKKEKVCGVLIFNFMPTDSKNIYRAHYEKTVNKMTNMWFLMVIGLKLSHLRIILLR